MKNLGEIRDDWVTPFIHQIYTVNETDTQVSQQRQALAEDSVSVEASTQSPYEQGFQEFKKAYDEGSPKEDSAARFVHTVLEAAGQGDERVIDGR